MCGLWSLSGFMWFTMLVCVIQSAKTKGLSVVEARKLQQRELEQNLRQSVAALR